MKTSYVPLVMLFLMSCTKESIKKTVPVTTQSEDKAVATFHIGDSYGGGIIFYLDTSGQHGLIASTSDQSTAVEWWNAVSFTITGAVAKTIGKGSANTKKIIKSQGNTGYNYAAKVCRNYRGGGFNDWYMPTLNELVALQKQKAVVGGFSDAYWSSTELSQTDAFFVNFPSGLKVFASKQTAVGVRAIRSF